MHDQPSSEGRLPADHEDRADAAVLYLLLDPDLNAPMSVDELVRAIGDELTVVDALRRLQAAGLIHRLDQFAFASQPARRFYELPH